MNFLLDENFPKTIRSVLEKLGHEVFDFREVGTTGSPDEEVIGMAIERRAVIALLAFLCVSGVSLELKSHRSKLNNLGAVISRASLSKAFPPLEEP